MLRAALCLGFNFLLRCSEYLSRGPGGWDLEKVPRGVDCSLKQNGRNLAPEEIYKASELQIFPR